MTQHKAPQTPVVSGSARGEPFASLAIGAGAGGFVALLAVAVSGHIVLPIGASILFGTSLGFAFWATRLQRRLPLFWLIASWGFVCGAFPLLLPALAGFLLLWVVEVGTSGFPLRGTGPSTTPLSITAAANAMEHVFLAVLVFGLPVYAIGWMVGAIVAVVKWRRGRNETSAPPAP